MSMWVNIPYMECLGLFTRQPLFGFFFWRLSACNCRSEQSTLLGDVLPERPKSLNSLWSSSLRCYMHERDAKYASAAVCRTFWQLQWS